MTPAGQGGYHDLTTSPPEALGSVHRISRAFFLAGSDRAVLGVNGCHDESRGAMHSIKSDFKAVSPMLHRRWGGRFYNPKLKSRRRKSVKPHFGYAKPRGQEN